MPNFSLASKKKKQGNIFMYKLILILLLAFINSCSSPLNPFAKEKEDNSMLIAAGAIATQSSRGGSVATQTTVGLTTERLLVLALRMIGIRKT